ncbi:uncharacterized protein N7473_011018 [Penicillium subrubescens]|uniref:E3 SUMO-protein ligase pli1 n=1 Tax=Penicillium subrubescens TaxID=1316194 RepID=A0A1Q5TEC2_9EURO|nr:uncharacterized protein N7473_011018 [Penicillium subrubescens]KAJ5884132.1 hypothetical protein N7473_011018 [Penicillium subrubescens]OKO98572.1 E3 SUMO-protein ligase pli1 [Penicillium subrubescens]
MASSGQLSEIPHLVALIKTLTNANLKDLLRNEGLAVSGVKASLQLRIIDYLERLANSEGNGARYDALRRRIYQTAIPGASAFQSSSPSYQLPPPPTAQATPSQPRPASLGGTMAPHASSHSHLAFKESPFFTILNPLTKVMECKVREQTRDSVELKVTLSVSTATDLTTDPNLRVMVYCAADSGLKQYTKSDITFPHQVELKANLDEVKANLRGLKNKPGTTQPADVTPHIRKKANYPNTIVMTYALTTKKFFVIANLVRQHPVDELVAQLKSRKIISKEQVIREMKNRAEDTDIVATSSIMSLKCPLSTLRIQVPCRSVVCTHNQCFDASSFLELQKQAPTWTCPVCSKSTSFESLQVDQYVDDILGSTSTEVDSVVVEPDGTWSAPSDADAVNLGGRTPASDDDDDDLIEIREPGTSAVKQEPMSANIMLERTPAQSKSREASTPSSAARLSSKKRPAAQVIDLTGSDDDDDESPVPPVKRPALNLGIRGIATHDPYQPGANSPLNNRAYPPPPY